jgi:hypothetical protein
MFGTHNECLTIYTQRIQTMAKKKFPDLTGDGKVTQADILKGKGVKKKKTGGMAKKGYMKGGMAKKGYMAGGMPMAGGAPKPPMGGMGAGAAPGMETPEQKKKRMMAQAAAGGGAPGGMPPKMPGMKKGGMAKKGYANGGVAKKKTKSKSKGKVRGAGIAKKGVRKCKMR